MSSFDAWVQHITCGYPFESYAAKELCLTQMANLSRTMLEVKEDYEPLPKRYR